MPSYSSIFTQVYTRGSDKTILLRDNAFTQAIAINERWTRLRIGCLLSMYSDGTSNILNSSFQIGMIKNAGNPLTATDSAFIGSAFPSAEAGGTGGTFTYTANSGFPFYATGQFQNFTRLNGTVSAGTSANPIRIPLCDVVPRSTVLIFDLAKFNATTWNSGLNGPALAHMSFDMGMADLYNALEQVANTPVLRGTAMQALATNAGLWTETAANPTNTIYLRWNRWAYPMQISGLAVYVIY